MDGKCNTLLGYEKYIPKFCEGKKLLGRLVIDGKVILNWVSKKENLGVWIVLSWLKARIREHSNEPVDCLKGEEFRDWVSSFLLPKKDCSVELAGYMFCLNWTTRANTII
jgi:hypothetical protein